MLFGQVRQAAFFRRCPNIFRAKMAQPPEQILTHTLMLPNGQNPLHQFLRSKSVTRWRGQKSVVSVVSCRFPNSITTTCCQQVGSFPIYGEVTGNVSNGLMDLGHMTRRKRKLPHIDKVTNSHKLSTYAVKA